MTFHAIMSLCVCRFLLQSVFLKLININVFVFILADALGFLLFQFHPYREITQSPLTVMENIFRVTARASVKAGTPKRAVSLHLVHSGSQLQRRIWFTLTAHRASHYYWLANLLKEGFWCYARYSYLVGYPVLISKYHLTACVQKILDNKASGYLHNSEIKMKLSLITKLKTGSSFESQLANCQGFFEKFTTNIFHQNAT